MRLYKLLSVLLQYPTQELCAHWQEIERLIPTLDNASEEDQQALQAFMVWARGLSLTQWQAAYVQTFDLTPDNALYLTHHLFEEQDRTRGPTLVKLSEYFKRAGYEIGSGELPDYLPLLLEYISTLEDELSAREFLRQSAPVSEIVAQNLEKIDSPYAPLLRIVERHGSSV
jgi:nitrate reductase molybdenum cofactor assembly chaperone